MSTTGTSTLELIAETDGRTLASLPHKDGESVMRTARRHNFFIRSTCFGGGECGDCLVHVVEGGEQLPKPGLREKLTLKRLGDPGNARLACMINPKTSIKVVVPRT